MLEETEAVFEVMYSITYSTMAMFVEQYRYIIGTYYTVVVVDIPVLNCSNYMTLITVKAVIARS